MTSRRRVSVSTVLYLAIFVNILGLSLGQHLDVPDSSKDDDIFGGIQTTTRRALSTDVGRRHDAERTGVVGDVSTAVDEVKDTQRKFGELPEMGLAREIGTGTNAGESELNRRIPETALNRPAAGQQPSGAENEALGRTEIQPHFDEEDSRFIDLDSLAGQPTNTSIPSNSSDTRDDNISVMLSHDHVNQTNGTVQESNVRNSSRLEIGPILDQMASELPLFPGDLMPTSTEQGPKLGEKVDSLEMSALKDRLPAEVTAPDPFQTTIIPPENQPHSKQMIPGEKAPIDEEKKGGGEPNLDTSFQADSQPQSEKKIDAIGSSEDNSTDPHSMPEQSEHPFVHSDSEAQQPNPLIFDVETPPPESESPPEPHSNSEGDLVIGGGRIATVPQTTLPNEGAQPQQENEPIIGGGIATTTPLDETVIAGDESIFAIDQEPHHQNQEESATVANAGGQNEPSSAEAGIHLPNNKNEDLVDRTGQNQGHQQQQNQGQEQGVHQQGEQQNPNQRSGNNEHGPQNSKETDRLNVPGLRAGEVNREGGTRPDTNMHVIRVGTGDNTDDRQEQVGRQGPMSGQLPPLPEQVTKEPKEPEIGAASTQSEIDAGSTRSETQATTSTQSQHKIETGAASTQTTSEFGAGKTITTETFTELARKDPMTTEMPEGDMPILEKSQSDAEMNNNETLSTIGEKFEHTDAPKQRTSESTPMAGEEPLPDLPPTTSSTMPPMAMTDLVEMTESTTRNEPVTADVNITGSMIEPQPRQEMGVGFQNESQSTVMMEVPASEIDQRPIMPIRESTTVMTFGGGKEMEMPKSAEPEPEPASTPFARTEQDDKNNNKNDINISIKSDVNVNGNKIDEQGETPKTVATTTIDPAMRELELAKAIRTPFTLRFPAIKFRSDFADSSSGQFRKFREQISNDMRSVLKEAFGANFLDFELIALRKGSVILDGRILTRDELVDPLTSAARLEEAIQARKGHRIGGNEVDPQSVAIDGIVSNGVAAQVAKANNGASVSNAQNTGYIIIGAVAVGVLIVVFAVFAIIVFGVNNRRNNGTLKLKDHEIGMVENGRGRVMYGGAANATTNSQDGISLTGYGRTSNGTSTAANGRSSTKASANGGKQTPMVLSGSQFVSPNAFRS